MSQARKINPPSTSSPTDGQVPLGSAADAPHGSRPDQVYARLRDLIVQGSLAPGSRIVETEIASRLGVSRTHSRPPMVLDIWPDLIFKWSPDSSGLYYRERQVGYQPESELLRLDALSGKSTTVLSTVPEYIVDISFSKDGKQASIVRGKNISNAVMLTASP